MGQALEAFKPHGFVCVNQSVEVEIPCYKYSKRLKRQVQRRDRERERVLKRRRREERSHEKKGEEKKKRSQEKRKRNQGKRSERVVNCQDLLTLPPRARLSIAGIFQLSGAKFGTHEVGSAILVVWIRCSLMGLLE